MATGAIDANGIYQYGEDDSEATFSALLNKLGASTSTQVAALRPAGRIVQTLSAFKSDSASTTSSAFGDISGLSVTITPKSSTSKFLIIVVGGVCQGSNANGSRININRGATAIDQGTGSTYNQSSIIYAGNQYTITPIALSYLDSPATASAVTYKVQFATDGGGTTYWGRRAPDTVFSVPSSITVLEVAA